MASTNFQMNSTLGQPSPLMEQGLDPYSENYGLLPGFWYTLDAGSGGSITSLLMNQLSAINEEISRK
jgi:hypothetical protein